MDRRSQQDAQIVQFIQQVRIRQPRLGTRKLHYLLRQQPEALLRVGRDRLFRVLAEYRLLVRPKRAYHKTTHSFHRFYRHPNLLKPGPRQVVPRAPEHVWVADITYLPSSSGPLYLSLVTDAYSRKIVGHHVHEGLHAVGCSGVQPGVTTAPDTACPGASLGPRHPVLFRALPTAACAARYYLLNDRRL